jgi:hypothetical protein
VVRVTTFTDLGLLFRALDTTSLDDAAAELDTLLHLADNAADELHMLAACTTDFPGDLADAFDRAARLTADATAELRSLHRGLGR